MELATLAGSALGRVVSAPKPPPDIPAGRMVELPGRGATCVLDIPGPPGAPTLMLLHALGTTARLSWYPSLDALGEHYRIVAFDQRWHGRGIRSPKFSLDDCADDVAAVADALGIERFTVVGYSMGGAIAQLVWRRHRRRVEGMVLAATARNFRGTVRERIWFWLTKAAMGRFGDHAHLRMHALASRLPHLPEHGCPESVTVSSWAMAEFRSTSLWSMFAAVDEIGRFESSAWIRRVDVPTSVIVATRDRFIPTHRQRKLAATIPGAVTFDVEGNHAALVLGAGEFVPVLVDACRSVTRRIEERA